MRRLKLLALVAGAAAAHAAGQIQDPHRASFSTDARIQLFESWVAADEASTANKTSLAGAYLQKARETNDFNYLDRAAKIVDGVLASHDDYQAKRLRILIALTLHHFPEAAGYAREMLRAAPTDPQLWGSLGDALLEMGDVAGARRAFQKMFEIEPGLFSYNRMAYLLFIAGDAPGAIAMMRQALQSGVNVPEHAAWCATELGHLYFKTGRLEEAAAAYRDAVDTFPASHAAHAGLGSIEAARNRPAAAVDHYKHAQAIAPLVQYAGALYDLYTALGRPAEANQQVVQIDLYAALDEASGQEANRTLALIYANQNRNLDRALAAAEADFRLRPGVYSGDVLAWVLYKDGRIAEALQTARHVVAATTPDALFYYHAGIIAHAAGEDAEAAADLERALALNPGFDIVQAPIAKRTLAAIRAR